MYINFIIYAITLSRIIFHVMKNNLILKYQNLSKCLLDKGFMKF
jgi:hypothetical protein